MSLVVASNGQALWYLTRGSGAVALLLLTVSVLLGVANTTRWKTNNWPRFIVYGLHRNVTLLALTFTAIHVITTIVDSFAPIGLVDAFIPFLSPYRPFWLGLGTVAFDLLLALILTSFLRRRIGNRTWRAVHWLAYASWPVAMLHSFGTGSDARNGWMLFLGVACGVTVLVAVLWRILRAPDAEPAIRAGATLATVGVLIGLLVWTANGPLQHGWAARAGTPASLLRFGRTRVPASVRTAAPKTPATPSVDLPKSRFTADVQGRIKEQQTDRGLVIVFIDGTAKGGFHGRLHIALRGFPVQGGGVQMTDSVVALLPHGASAWSSGTVTGLDGTRIESNVANSDGQNVHVLISLHIGAGTSFTGSLTGAPLS
jgi:DMSO/TMAO reductase YedYZ heme-binding membrane subunit